MGKVLKIVAGVALIGLSLAMPGLGIAGFQFFGAITIGAGTILAAGASLLLSTLAPKPKIPETQLSRLNISMDAGTPRKAVMGTTAFPLDLRYHEATGSDQEYIHYIIAHAAHKVRSIDEIWLEQDLAWSASGGVTSKYNGYLTVTTRTEGAAGNEISISGTWGSGERLTGCAYTYIKIKRTGNDKKSESPLVSGLPQRITVIGEGAYLYDPRLDSTVDGGSGTHRADDQTTWGSGYSPADSYDNPALQILWWLLGWKINGKLSVGCGVPPARIDLPSFIEAANICDESVGLSGGGTQERYRSSATASDADDRMGIINALLQTCNGTLRDADGKLSLSILKDDLADYVLDFDDNDILGEFTWQQTRGLNESYNVARGRFVDPSNNSLYQMVDYPEVSIASPDGIERVMTLDLAYVEDGKRAQRIAKQVLQRNQYRGTFQAVFSMKALGCNVGEIVRLSFETLGWSNKLFRVTAKEIRMDGQVPLTLIEENAAIYAWSAEEAAVVSATAPTTYNPLNSPFILADVEAADSAAAAITAAATAQATADGKVTTFYQSTAPTAEAEGDLWIDTDVDRLYRWNGLVWVEIQDAGITQAISDAADAQSTADSKIVTFYEASAPTADGVGDLWFDTDDDNKLYRWNGTTWVNARDQGIVEALADAAAAQLTADSKVTTFYQASAPTAEGEGDIWFDTDDGNKPYRWDGSSWVLAQDEQIGTAITNAATAQATADGKVTTYIDDAEPYPIDLQTGTTSDSPSLSLDFSKKFNDGDIWFTPGSKIVSRYNRDIDDWTQGLADVTKSVSGASSLVLNYSSDGSSITSVIPKTSLYQLAPAGGSALTSGVTWSVSTRLVSGQTESDIWTGTVPSISGSGRGQLSINSGLEVTEATLDITATVDGITYPPFSVTVSKVLAAAESGGGGSSDFANKNIGGKTISGTTFTEIQSLSITTGSGVTSADLTASSIPLYPPTGETVSATNIQFKWQYESSPGVWTDIGAAADSDPDPFTYYNSGDLVHEPVPGSITCNRTQTGLTGSTAYNFRLMARCSTGDTSKAFTASGTVSAQG